MYTRFFCFIVMMCLFGVGVGWVGAQDAVPGQLAYIGSDANVYSYDFTTGMSHALTTDATPVRRYQWPTWSQDGRLAYFCCDTQMARSFEMQGYISGTGVEPGRLVYEQSAAPVIYAAWAPAPCDDSGACRQLALLVNDVQAGELRVDLVQDTGDDETIETIARGNPFYYTWSPDATQMVFHRFGSELAVYDVTAKKISRTYDTTSPVTFQAPAWSPIDDRILSLIPGTERDRSTLIVSTDEKQQTPLRENLSGQISFLWSPDGRYVAYRQVRDGDYGALFVVDAVTGEVVGRSDVSGVIAFFWSPDSTQLAYITVDFLSGQQADDTFEYQQQGSAQLEWSTLNVTSGRNQRLIGFLPTNEMIYLLLYFDQFAPSHRIWSPDSRYLVFGEIGDQDPLISIFDVQTMERRTIDKGVFGVWSWQ